MAITISLLALIATFYQLHLQRVHNEKSLMPLAQIDLVDREKLAVHIQNNGVGPLIVSKVSFSQFGKTYPCIRDCLSLNPQSFQHTPISPETQKVIMPGAFLEIFSTIFDETDSLEVQEKTRVELASIQVIVEGRDIYKNKVSVKRGLEWFLRHSQGI